MPAGSGRQRYAGTPPQTRRYSEVTVQADQNGELEQHRRQHIPMPYSAMPPRSVSQHRVSISSLPDTLSRSTPPVLGGREWWRLSL
ncbi:hypothetical protein BD309DRAFT_995569 [Dichomitus squalens]|nr:hypothetical protein BD309DRAFT_995569 [Dichomitus squalens]